MLHCTERWDIDFRDFSWRCNLLYSPWDDGWWNNRTSLCIENLFHIPKRRENLTLTQRSHSCSLHAACLESPCGCCCSSQRSVESSHTLGLNLVSSELSFASDHSHDDDPPERSCAIFFKSPFLIEIEWHTTIIIKNKQAEGDGNNLQITERA